MTEEVVHYYNVIMGQQACGMPVNREVGNFTVFPEKVNCPVCVSVLDSKKQVNEGGSGK
jgi:hypothetical protein